MEWKLAAGLGNSYQTCELAFTNRTFRLSCLSLCMKTVRCVPVSLTVMPQIPFHDFSSSSVVGGMFNKADNSHLWSNRLDNINSSQYRHNFSYWIWDGVCVKLIMKEILPILPNCWNMLLETLSSCFSSFVIKVQKAQKLWWPDERKGIDNFV